MRIRSLLLPMIAALTVTMVGAACGGAAPADGRIRIEASFHPLAFLARRIGGERVHVGDLTRTGADAHHLELRARDIGAMIDADLVLYLQGFQPAVDAAISEVDDHAVDVTDAADLEPLARSDDLDSHDGHDGHDAHGDHGDHGRAVDLHFWTDPERMAAVAVTVRDHLIAIDPDGAVSYRANTEALVADLTGLVDRYETMFQDCASRDLVVTHASFGYLAERFDLRQVPITGLIPTEDPSGARLRDTVRFVRNNDVTTVFHEPGSTARIADTVAAEAGVTTAVLDPIENLSDDSPGDDYLEIMDANLTTLRDGLRCR